MNMIVKLNPEWGLNLEREFQLEYLKSKGLMPNSILLDYGCGALSAGRFFIDYLNEGCYIGTDVAKAVLAEGSRRLTKLGLDEKKVRLLHIKNNNIPHEKIGKVDFIWAQSVVTHMSPEDLSAMISQVGPMMDKDSIFLFSFTNNDSGVNHRNFKDWEYDLDTLIEISERHGFVCEIQNDWKHPDDDAGIDRVVRLRLSDV
tara:strand:+ start:183 stop:785 length:603 start_codon:yes stop_codon:yes gene_type:complete